MDKEKFIKKWNTAFEDLEQEVEFEKEMSEDLDLLLKRQTDLIKHLQNRIRIAEIKTK